MSSRVVSLTLFFMVLTAGCGDGTSYDEPTGIPITTSSDEARAAFLEGRSLNDKLQATESLAYFDKAISLDPTFAMAHLSRGLASPSNKEFFEHLAIAMEHVEHVSEGERHWLQGFEAGVNGNLEARGEHYTKLVELHPDDPRAHFLLGGHYGAIQDFDAAASEYRRAIELAPDHSPAYNSLGYTLRALERNDEAEEAFKSYIELIPDDPNPYDSYAELMMRMGRFDESIQSYGKALEVDPAFVASNVGIASNLMFQGKHEEALARLQTMHDSARNDGERRQALINMAVVSMDAGNVEEALAHLDALEAVAAAIDDKGAQSGDAIARGNVLCEAGRPDEAVTEFERALQLARESTLSEGAKRNVEVGHHRNQARAALVKGDLDTAQEELNIFLEAVEANPNPNQLRQAHEIQGLIALAGQDYDAAVEALSMANQQSPYVLFKLALAYQAQGNATSAAEFCEKVANHNTLPTLRYAAVRRQAHDLLASM